MEFHEKLQELRKKKGITQEELAQALYVSRAAVSKWESGRGYPNLESLKAIADFFGVTVDELLSGEELLTVAEKNSRQKEDHIRDLVFGLLDLSVALFLFLPLFGQKIDGILQEVSLLSLTEISAYLKIGYYMVVAGIILTGIFTLALQNWENALWVKMKTRMSLALNAVGVLLLIISKQPYGAIFLFAFLLIKVIMLLKKQ